MRCSAGPSRWAGWGVGSFVLLTALTAPESARAACSFSGPGFGQLAPNCGGTYCYVISPGQHTADSLAATFWSFGSGDPQTGSGTDNGAWSFGNWLYPDGSSLYLAGDWGSPAIDGCIAGQVAPGKPAEIMVALISDEANGSGFFAIASARRVAGSIPEFDFTFVAGGGLGQDINLVDIPHARVVSSTRGSLRFAGPTLADASAGSYGDGSLAPGEVVKGYRIYQNATSFASTKTSAGWVAATEITPLGQDVTIPFSCPPSEHAYYGYTLVFDGNFETAHVGRPISVLCRYCVDADGDGFPSLLGDPECCPGGDCYDCNDGNASVHPFALEVCNGVDDNCDGLIDNASLPGSVAALQFDKQPGTTRIDWPALPVATSYDVVRGELIALLLAGGDYSAATTSCAGNDVTVPHVDDAQDPDPGGYGFWYLIRAANCTGVGSYNTPEASQAASRDPGIAASGHACP